MMTRLMLRALSVALAIACAGCCCDILNFIARPVGPAVPQEVSDLFLNKDMWLYVNLRIENGLHDPDGNCPEAPFLKVGTKVRVIRLSMSEVELAPLDTGKSFRLLVKRGESEYDTWVYRYLSVIDVNDYICDRCPEDIRVLIVEGRIQEGMTTEHVLMSWGFPPGIECPEDVNEWTYPRKSGEKTTLLFESGILKEIK